MGRRRWLVTLGGEHGATRVRGGRHCAALGPGSEVVYCVDDAPAELAVSRAGSIGAVLLQGAGGEGEEFRGFLGAQVARRKNGEIGSLRPLGEGGR